MANELKKKDIDKLIINSENILEVWAEVERINESIPCLTRVLTNLLNKVPSVFKIEGVMYSFRAIDIDDKNSKFQFWSESFGNYRSWLTDKKLKFIVIPTNVGTYRENLYVHLFFVNEKYYKAQKDSEEIHQLYENWCK